MHKSKTFKSKLLTFEGFNNKDDFSTLLNDFLDSDDGMDVLQAYFDNIYKVEHEEALKAHEEDLKQLEAEFTEIQDELNAELSDIESTIKEKQKLLDYIENEIARKELAEQYMQRNNIFAGRTNSLDERIAGKIKLLAEAQQDDNVNDVITEDSHAELTGAQQLAFMTYCKNGKGLVELKALVANGMQFNKALENITVIDRSKRELILKGVNKLEESKTKILTVSDMVEHLYK